MVAAAPPTIAFFTHENDIAPTNGNWRVRSGRKPTAAIRPSQVGPAELSINETLSPAAGWTEYDFTFPVSESPELSMVTFRFESTGGVTLIDDVEIYIDGDTNPTIFRDELVDVLQFLKPGTMRMLINRADDIRNRIRPRKHTYAMRTFNTVARIDFGMHEFYELADYLDFAPWYTLPGSMTPEDVEF